MSIIEIISEVRARIIQARDNKYDIKLKIETLKGML
jgi:hypothetical protein